jgi:hypothetical protein
LTPDSYLMRLGEVDKKAHNTRLSGIIKTLAQAHIQVD